MLGRSLGNYNVVSKIGEGGMGVVYMARHATLGRPFAIKVLHSSLSSNQDMVTRFFNEARAATAVRNPGIVEVFDYGRLDDGCAYIVMEYLEGESLGARIRRGRFDVAPTMTIVRAIARALQAAHEQNIVHRDLKPDNIFLVPDPELATGERVKLLDFGIAKLAPISGEVSQTRTGMVMGTPTYMAPEQCRGAGSVDHRADLYALGCVAYQMMCGEPPFVSDGAGEVIARHLYFEPQPLRTHRADLPADVDDLVLWLLRKDPAARPKSAADLVRAIDHLATVSVKGVMQTTPPTRFSAASLAPVVETTLGGAASSVSLPTGVPRTGIAQPRRTALFAGIAAGAIAVIAMLFVVLRGRNDDTPGPSTSVAVAATGERNPDSPPPPPPVPPPSASPPSSGSPSSGSPSVVSPPATSPSAGSPSVASPSSPPPASASPSVASPSSGSPSTSPSVAAAASAPHASSAASSAAADQADRGDRTDRKKRGSPRTRVAAHEPEPTSGAAVEPAPPPPTPAPAPPSPAPTPAVAHPRAPEPPPAEPPRVAAKPVAAPSPAAPTAPPVVSASAVSKLSGAVPAIKVKGLSAEFADVVVKLCIDEQGAVASVKLVKAPAEIAGDLQQGLRSWRYTPYVNPSGVQSAACFPLSFRVVFK